MNNLPSNSETVKGNCVAIGSPLLVLIIVAKLYLYGVSLPLLAHSSIFLLFFALYNDYQHIILLNKLQVDFRIGFLAASENVIDHLANVRILLDRQGDHILDNAMAEMLTDGTVQRYIRKVLTVYHQRRDNFCSLLKNELGDVINFSVPEGGMTVWSEFEKNLNLKKVAEQAYSKGLYFSDGTVHKYSSFNKNATRLGFASSIDVLSQSIDIPKKIIL